MLKPLEEVLTPDPRYAEMMVETAAGWRPITLSDHHGMVSKVHLTSAAPDDIRQMFSRATSCALYAWFDYELTPLAEQQAFATLEAALRRYFNVEGSSLWNLVERAVSKRLFEPTLGGVELQRALATMRNELAHGSINFGTPGMALTMIGYVSQLIGRLYPGQEPHADHDTGRTG